MAVEITSRSTKVEVTQVAPRIGAVVHGVDLSEDLPDEVFSQIRDAVVAHRVVFFRDQNLDQAGHLAFARRFGPLTLAHPTLPASSFDPALYDLDSQQGSAANHWHTDVTFVDRPPTLSILRAVVIPPLGGDTLWASTVAGYEDLPRSLKALADSLRAVHTNGQDYGRADMLRAGSKARPERLKHVEQFISTVYETEHPVVRTHAVTEEPSLLLGGFAQRLVGHRSTESVDILRTFQSYVTRPENTVRWQWRPGDVAVWDNRSTQHYAIYDYGPQHRRVERVTTIGTIPVGLDGVPSVSLRGDASHYYRET